MDVNKDKLIQFGELKKYYLDFMEGGERRGGAVCAADPEKAELGAAEAVRHICEEIYDDPDVHPEDGIPLWRFYVMVLTHFFCLIDSRFFLW